MEFTQSGLSLAFEVTFDDPALDVGLAVFDVTSGSPVQVGAVLPMVSIYGNTYMGRFTPSAGKSYLFNKSVYTDNTLTTIDDAYPQGSETIRSEDIAGILLNAILNNYQNVGSVGAAIKKSSQSSGSGTPLIGIIKTDTLDGEVGDNMSCDICACPREPWTIYTSGDTPVNFRLTYPDGRPFDISGADEIWAMFQPKVAPPVILKLSQSDLTIDNGGGGEFSGVMSVSNAALLKEGLIDVEIRVTIGSKISVAEILQQVNVVASLFPGY